MTKPPAIIRTVIASAQDDVNAIHRLAQSVSDRSKIVSAFQSRLAGSTAKELRDTVLALSQTAAQAFDHLPLPDYLLTKFKVGRHFKSLQKPGKALTMANFIKGTSKDIYDNEAREWNTHGSCDIFILSASGDICIERPTAYFNYDEVGVARSNFLPLTNEKKWAFAPGKYKQTSIAGLPDPSVISPETYQGLAESITTILERTRAMLEAKEKSLTEQQITNNIHI